MPRYWPLLWLAAGYGQAAQPPSPEEKKSRREELQEGPDKEIFMERPQGLTPGLQVVPLLAKEELFSDQEQWMGMSGCIALGLLIVLLIKKKQAKQKAGKPKLFWYELTPIMAQGLAEQGAWSWRLLGEMKAFMNRVGQEHRQAMMPLDRQRFTGLGELFLTTNFNEQALTQALARQENAEMLKAFSAQRRAELVSAFMKEIPLALLMQALYSRKLAAKLDRLVVQEIPKQVAPTRTWTHQLTQSLLGPQVAAQVAPGLEQAIAIDVIQGKEAYTVIKKALLDPESPLMLMITEAWGRSLYHPLGTTFSSQSSHQSLQERLGQRAHIGLDEVVQHSLLRGFLLKVMRQELPQTVSSWTLFFWIESSLGTAKKEEIRTALQELSFFDPIIALKVPDAALLEQKKSVRARLPGAVNAAERLDHLCPWGSLRELDLQACPIAAYALRLCRRWKDCLLPLSHWAYALDYQIILITELRAQEKAFEKARAAGGAFAVCFGLRSWDKNFLSPWKEAFVELTKTSMDKDQVDGLFERLAKAVPGLARKVKLIDHLVRGKIEQRAKAQRAARAGFLEQEKKPCLSKEV